MRAAVPLALLALASLHAATPSAFAATEAEEAFAAGQSALAQADFAAADASLTRAARLAPDNQDYRQEALLLRRVLAVRERLDRLEGTPQWGAAAESLCAYYVDHQAYEEALKLGRQLHTERNTAASAAALAQTLLLMNRNDDAADVLADWTGDRGTVQTRALRGIALAREKRTDAARALAEQVSLDADTPPAAAFDVARLCALLGNEPGATAALTHCLQRTPPSQLDKVRASAKTATDFGTLRQSESFVAVLQTESQVKESACSGGSSCAGCPSRATCSEEADRKQAPPADK